MSANESIRSFSEQFDGAFRRIGSVFGKVATSLGLAALLCLALPGALSATSWTLTATFSDSGTANGSFTLNNGVVTNWNIVASGYSNELIPAFTFTPQNSSANYSTDGGNNCGGPCLQFISNQQFSNDGSPAVYGNLMLDLTFLADLSGTGTVYLYVHDSSENPSNECFDCENYQRYFSSGSATQGSPVPAGSQPSGTTVYVLNEDESFVSVTNAAPTPLAASACEYCSFDMARDASGNFIVAAGNQLTIYTPNGGQLSPITPPVADEQNFESVAIDAAGNYIVLDGGNSDIIRISPDSPNTQPVVATVPLDSYGYVRVDAAGNYILALETYIYNPDTQGEQNSFAMFRITPPASGIANCVTQANGCVAITINSGNYPAPSSTGGLTFDANGNYVNVDWNNDIIYTITPAGVATPLFSDPNGYLQDAEGIYRDPASGNFFLVDDENNALYMFSANGSNFSQIVAGGLLTSPGALIVVDAPPPPPVYQPVSITTSLLPNGVAGQPYGPAGMAATGGSGSFSWSASGAPAGVSMSSAGVLSGIPTAAGTFSVTVQVSDAIASMSAQDTFTISIAFQPLSLNGPAALGGFAPTAAISAAYTATGGQAPYTWSATGLPAGLTLDPVSGKLSGAISQPGNYGFVVQVSDAEPVSTSLSVSVFVPGITTTSLPDGTNNIPYSQTLGAIGGNPPFAWSVNGTLPPGLTLSSSGVLSGTPVLNPVPASPQTFAFGVSLTTSGVTVSENLSMKVTLTPEALSIPGAGDNAISLPTGPVQVDYSQALQAAGGIPPYSWSVLAGALPDGLSLSTGGTISGTPTKVGSFGFTAQVTDTSGGRASAGFSIAIAPPSLTITTGSPLPNGIAGTSYPIQVFTATGGMAPYTFQEKGPLPSGLTFSNGQITGTPAGAGTSSFTITATDSSQPALTASSEFQIPVEPAHTDLVLSETSLSFSFNAGAISLPVGTASASVTVASNATQTLGYAISVVPAASWLDVTVGGNTPGIIHVSVDPTALTLGAGVSRTSIVVTCTAASGSSQPSPCAGTSQTIPVTLKVLSVPPQLVVSSDLLAFTAQSTNPATSSLPLILQNAGGGTITVNSITSGSNFVSFSGVPTSIPASGTVSVNVNANPAGLANGYYQGTVLVSTSVGSANIPLTLLVSQNPTMTLNPSGNQFQMLTGTAPGNSNGSFLVGVASSTAVAWNAAVLTSVPASNWLQLNTSTGSSTSAHPGAVSYSINAAVASTLAPQVYYGTIQVTSTGVADSPQNFLVVLNVVTAISSIQPDPEPAGLLFIANGSAALPPQTVQVFTSSLATVTFSASSDSAWLSVNVGGTAVTSSPGFSSISVNQAGLLPGVYRGNVSYQLTSPGESTEVRAVSVTLIVEGASAGASAISETRNSSEALPLQVSASCAQLVPTPTGLANSFAQPASWPTPLTVQLVDNCAHPVTAGQIVATFSNGDPPLALSPTDATSGNYTGTWTPRNTSAQITISARATATGFAPATVQISGQVTPNATPLLAHDGTLNAFSAVLGGAVAPGTIVQIYGSNLASQTASAAAIPLPNKLNSTSVLIGGLLAPLYFVSPGQINAQVPFELTAGKQYQVIVNANGALSTPNPIQLAADAPGVLGFATGQIIATHLDSSLVLETAPAAPGEIIVFYVAGMGLTNQTVASGTASPSQTLAQPLDQPTVTLGGIAVTNIIFAGLTPTLVGLYQVDFQVPASAPNGDLQLVLTQASGQSNTTVVPVHN